MAALRPTTAPVFATLIILTSALIVREFLRARLLDAGYAANVAKDLSYFVVPAMLAIMMWPIFSRHREHFRHIFRVESLTPKIIACGVLVGVCLRIAWWSYLVAGISFGLIGDATAGATIGPTFRFACPPPVVILLGIVVMAGLTPLVEETIDRGLLLSGLLHRGRVFAILVSTLIFMLAHTSSTYAAVFIIGLVFAVQYTMTGAIWFSLATHAAYNALIQLDWHCLNGQWNPPTAQLPLTFVGIAAVSMLLLSASLIYLAMRVATAGTLDTPRL